MKYKNVAEPPHILFVRYLNIMDGEWANLKPLLPWADVLRGLSLNAVVEDISDVSRFTRLRELAVSEFCSGGFCVMDLPNLMSLWLEVGVDRQVRPGGGDHLRWLGLSRATQEWAEWLETLPALQCLRLDNPKCLPVRLPPLLEKVEISRVTRWDARGTKFDGPAEIREIHLTGIRGMSDLSAFSFARKVSLLYLEDCAELVTVEGPGLAPGAKIIPVGLTPRTLG